MSAPFKPNFNVKPWDPFHRVHNAKEIVDELIKAPEKLKFTVLQDKRPLRKNWQEEEPLSRQDIADLILYGQQRTSKKGNLYRQYWSGYGLRTGEISGGVLAIDCDGSSAQELLRAIAGEPPVTVSWTSGKPGRYQLLFQVPDKYRSALANFKRAVLTEWNGVKTLHDEDGKPVEILEFRYNRSQSCMPPSRHPESGAYSWINSPDTTEIALLPECLCELVLELAEKETKVERQRKERAINYANLQKEQKGGVVTDLVDFLNFEILPRLSVEQIYNDGHDFRQYGEVLKGSPTWRASSSGTSFHVWWDGTRWAWQDKGLNIGGGPVEYRYILRGGSGMPRGKEWIDIVKELAAEAGLKLPEKPGAIAPSAEAEAQSQENQPLFFNKDRKPRADQAKVDAIQRELNGLEIKPQWNVIEVNTQYLGQDENLVKNFPSKGIVVLPQPMAYGKSVLIEMVLNQIFPNRPAISITPTITLGKSQCADWNIPWREDLIVNGVSNDTFLRNSPRIGLCYPSLHRLIHFDKASGQYLYRDNQDLILITDEVREGLQFLLHSPMANDKGRRAENIHAFKSLTIDANENNLLWLMADANVTNAEILYAQMLCPGLPVYVVVTKPVKRPEVLVDVYDRPQPVLDRMYSLLASGQNILIADDGQERGDTNDRLFTIAGFNGIGVDRESLKDDAIAQEFVENPARAIAKYLPQFLRYSPSLVSGFNIKITWEIINAYRLLIEHEKKKPKEEEPSGKKAELPLFEPPREESNEPDYETELKRLQANVEEAERNWASGTPYFTEKFVQNTHLAPCLIRQMYGRGRHQVPITIYCGQGSPRTGCTSPLPNEQLNQIVRHYDGLRELAQMNWNDDSFDDDVLKSLEMMGQIYLDASRGNNPELKLWSEQKAREEYAQQDRIYKLCNEIVEKDGYTVRLHLAKEQKEEYSSELLKEHQEIKEGLRKEKASKFVATQIPTEEEFKKLELKKVRTKEEEYQVLRYRFEREFPTLIGQLSTEKAEKFYYEAVLKDRRKWLESIKNEWGYKNKDKTKFKDLEDVKFASLRFSRNGIPAIQDTRKIKIGRYEFLDRIGFFNSIPIDDFEATYTHKSFGELFKQLSKKKNKIDLKTYFNTQLPEGNKGVIQ